MRERLNAEIAEAGLEIEAWLDRTVVEKALRQVYNEEGFLKAEVVGRPLTIDGTIGVLWFDIKEGPRAQITSLKWAGVAESRAAGDARRPRRSRRRRRTSPPTSTTRASAIEEHYRRQGFNDVEVEIAAGGRADDTVALTFTRQSKGTQQVLQERRDRPATRSRNGKVLTQALRFELGKPVDLDEWTLARKRLYDTNVFRLVDIQPVPVGDPVNGVQQVKAVVTVEEYPQWSVRYGFQLEGERQAELDEFTSTRNAGVVGEVRNPNLFGRALTGGVFGMYQRDQPGRVGVRRDVTAVRLARALDALWLLSARSRPRRRRRRVAGDHRHSRASAPISAGGAAASRSSTAIASSAITRSIREPPTIRCRSTSSPTSRS